MLCDFLRKNSIYPGVFSTNFGLLVVLRPKRQEPQKKTTKLKYSPSVIIDFTNRWCVLIIYPRGARVLSPRSCISCGPAAVFPDTHRSVSDLNKRLFLVSKHTLHRIRHNIVDFLRLILIRICSQNVYIYFVTRLIKYGAILIFLYIYLGKLYIAGQTMYRTRNYIVKP